MSDLTPNYPETYSQEEIQEILQIAIADRHAEEELSREHLWEIAAELDIDGSIIQAAETHWLERKSSDRLRGKFNLVRRQKFQQKLTKFAIVNTFLVSFNLILIGTLSWSLYILLFWSLGMALNGWKAYQTNGEEYERSFQRWRFQNDVKQTVSTVWTKVQQAWQA